MFSRAHRSCICPPNWDAPLVQEEQRGFHCSPRLHQLLCSHKSHQCTWDGTIRPLHLVVLLGNQKETPAISIHIYPSIIHLSIYDDLFTHLIYPDPHNITMPWIENSLLQHNVRRKTSPQCCAASFQVEGSWSTTVPKNWSKLDPGSSPSLSLSNILRGRSGAFKSCRGTLCRCFVVPGLRSKGSLVLVFNGLEGFNVLLWLPELQLFLTLYYSWLGAENCQVVDSSQIGPGRSEKGWWKSPQATDQLACPTLATLHHPNLATILIILPNW